MPLIDKDTLEKVLSGASLSKKTMDKVRASNEAGDAQSAPEDGSTGSATPPKRPAKF